MLPLYNFFTKLPNISFISIALSLHEDIINHNAFKRDIDLGLAQINKSTPVDSDAELNSPNLIQFESKLLVKKNRKPKLLVKYVIITYALGSAHEKFGV